MSHGCDSACYATYIHDLHTKGTVLDDPQPQLSQPSCSIHNNFLAVFSLKGLEFCTRLAVRFGVTQHTLQHS